MALARGRSSALARRPIDGGAIRQAVAACRRRHELAGVLVDTRQKLDALVVEAERPAGSGGRRRCRRAVAGDRPRGATDLPRLLTEGQHPAADLTERLTAVGQAFAAREAAQREAELQARQEKVVRVQRLVERAKRATEADGVTLREGERLMRDISAGLDEAAAAEGKEIQEAAGRLRSLQEKVAPRVRELREMDEWRRFANAQQQEQLIAMAEAIVASLKSDMETGKDSDLMATARRAAGTEREMAGSGRGAAAFGATAVGTIPHRH